MEKEKEIERLKQRALSEIGGVKLKVLGYGYLITLLGFVSFPLYWVWIDYKTALKISFTCLCFCVVLFSLHKFINNILKKAIDIEFKNNPPTKIELNKSNFNKRLDEMMKKNIKQ